MIVRKASTTLKVTNYPLTDSWYLSREEEENGTGDIYFMTELADKKKGLLRGLGFSGVRDVRKVEQILRDLKGIK